MYCCSWNTETRCKMKKYYNQTIYVLQYLCTSNSSYEFPVSLCKNSKLLEIEKPKFANFVQQIARVPCSLVCTKFSLANLARPPSPPKLSPAKIGFFFSEIRADQTARQKINTSSKNGKFWNFLLYHVVEANTENSNKIHILYVYLPFIWPFPSIFMHYWIY